MVFEEFARLCGRRAEFIGNREPPEPDILSCIDGEVVYFELTLGTDESLERAIADCDQGQSQDDYRGYGGHPVDVYSGVRAQLLKKLAKSYEIRANGANRIDLLVYMESGIERKLMLRMVAESELLERIRTGPFSIVWFYDRTWGVIGTAYREPPHILLDWRYTLPDFRMSTLISSVR